jgi:hypothetical protein
MTRFTFRVRHPIPALQARPGDLLVVRPGEAHPISVMRCASPNYGLVLLCHEQGALELVEGDATSLPLALGVNHGRPGPPRRGRRRETPVLPFRTQAK